MRKIEDVKEICLKELDELNIPYNKNLEFKINSRLKTTWGCCTKKQDTYIVEISKRAMQDNVPLETAKSILIHEIIHTCKNCMNHGYLWKNYVAKVNRFYGYNIKRTNSSAEYKCEKNPTDYKHMVECAKCGLQYFRTRETPLTKNPSNYKCGKCGGNLVKKY